MGLIRSLLGVLVAGIKDSCYCPKGSSPMTGQGLGCRESLDSLTSKSAEQKWRKGMCKRTAKSQ